MGNLTSKDPLSPAAREELKPSQPLVTLSELGEAGTSLGEETRSGASPGATAVTEEIRLSWKPPKRYRKFVEGYRVEMWDIPSRTWVVVTTITSEDDAEAAEDRQQPLANGGRRVQQGGDYVMPELSSSTKRERRLSGRSRMSSRMSNRGKSPLSVSGGAASNVAENCVLSNILSGMLYQFRVIALLTNGRESEPSDASDAFIVDIPDVNIAPYFVNAVPDSAIVMQGDCLALRAEALGTPKPSLHWYKDGEEIFLAEGVSIIEKDIGSELRVDNVRFDDGGSFSVSAINTVGKCTASTAVRIAAKPEFLMPMDEGYPVVMFREGEMVRLKLPLVGLPVPELVAIKVEKAKKPSGVMALAKGLAETDVWLKYNDSSAVFQIPTCTSRHAGEWAVVAKNEYGQTQADIRLVMEDEPDLRPGTPIIEDCAEGKEDSEPSDPPLTVSLSWEPPRHAVNESLSVIYHVEYYRDQWQLWLKGKTCRQPLCTLTDLVPGSYYKFRVRTHTESLGLSGPSGESDSVFLGEPPEDELFGLPGGNYPKSQSNLMTHRQQSYMGMGFGGSRSGRRRRRRCHSSLTQLRQQTPEEDGGDAVARSGNVSSDSGLGNKTHGGNNGNGGVPRHTSLEREVYYSKDNERKEVVTYSKLGTSVVSRFNMSREEEKAYKDSMGDLCSMLKKASREKLDGKKKKKERGGDQGRGQGQGLSQLDDNGNGGGGDNVVALGRFERRALSRTPIDEEGEGPCLLGHAVSRTSIYSDIGLD